MKRLSLLLGLVLLVALAACGGQNTAQPTATTAPAPTEAPAVEAATEVPAPTAEPEVVAPTIVVDPALIDTSWHWISRDSAAPLDIAEPQRYGLLFNADGTFFATLDCNQGSGSYVTPGDGSITMVLGPMTRAMCAEDSLSNEMIAMLGSAVSYAFEHEGEVLAFTMADGSVDRYSKADTAAAGALPTMDNADPALVDRVWKWTARQAGDAEFTINNPEDYSLTFNDDGTFYARLDCNNGGGTYTLDGATLNASLMHTTLAMCPEGSMVPEMSAIFDAPVTYAISGGTLTLTHADGTVDTYIDNEPRLTGTVWQWLGTTTATEPITVADSSRYTVEFLEDGTAAIKADCNQVVANYTAEEGVLSIMPGPMTLAACPEDSQGDIFVQQLGAAGPYFFMEGDLYIDLFADGGTMRFSDLPTVDLPTPEAGAPTGTVNAPDGVNLRTGPGTNFPAVGTAPQGDSGTLIGISEDGAWYVVAAPNLPNGQVWVAAEFVDAANADNLPVVATPPAAQSLVGPLWMWAGTTTPEDQIDVVDPTRYTVEFLADGTAAIGADCNRAVVSWTTDGQSITITPGPMTLAACAEDSQADQFMQQLTNAAIFFFQGSDLFIDQFASAGTMRFVTSLATAPIAPVPPVSGPSGLSFRVVSFGPAGAEQPVIEGTAIDAVFDQEAGRVSGNAGCNNYTGPMNTAAGSFKMGPFATTMMFCGEPEGVMEQEAAYLAALAGATGFSWAVQPNSFITNGQVTYTLADGTSGVINFVSP
ncbi:MAG: META domain-containing protein [Anaerolineae bacterium]|nr:META domain-containing protein [Anaerolineae bacterium]